MPDKINFNGRVLSLSENENKTELNAKVLICPLDESNLNNVGIKKADALKDNQYLTLNTQPAVAKVVVNENDELDFSGHNVKQITVEDENGNPVTKYIFDTVPIGVFTSTSIEDIELDGVTKSCIVANVSFWLRYKNAISVINRLFAENNLHVSWEISYTDYTVQSGTKWLTSFYFVGVAVLGSTVLPAYPDAGVMEISEINKFKNEFSEALILDLKKNKELIKLSTKSEAEENLNNENITSSINNEEDNKINDNIQGGIKDMSEKAKETIKENSSLTDNDLYTKVRQAINNATDDWFYIAYLFPLEFRCYAYRWDDLETEFTEFKFTVNSDDTVSITSQAKMQLNFVPVSDVETQISERDTKISELEGKLQDKEKELSEKVDALTKVAEESKAKDTQISELTPFKEQVEKANAEKAKAELSEKREKLKAYATKGGYIKAEELETSEEIKSAIAEVDESKIKGIIADRIIAELDKKEAEQSSKSEGEVETSSVEKQNVKLNLHASNSEDNPVEAIMSYIHE